MDTALLSLGQAGGQQDDAIVVASEEGSEVGYKMEVDPSPTDEAAAQIDNVIVPEAVVNKDINVKEIRQKFKDNDIAVGKINKALCCTGAGIAPWAAEVSANVTSAV